MPGVSRRLPQIAVLIALCAIPSAAREDDYATSGPAIKYFRASGKVGSPDLFGFMLEGIVPGIGDWLGVYSGFTYLPIGSGNQTTDGVETERSRGGLNHIGAGLNLYPFGGGRGLFASGGWDRVSAWNKVTPDPEGRSMVNPTHLVSLQAGYRYVGRIFTYSFMGGYGLNFGYEAPDVPEDETVLFKEGNWILFGFSFGVAFPVGRD